MLRRVPVQVRRQEERSTATRQALLDATVTCLADLGYAGTTSAAVAARAGLSRGAQLHHFGTRDKLVVAAVEHLAHKRLQLVRYRMSPLTGAGRSQEGASVHSRREQALQLLADALSGRLYAATLELWVAARSHEALRAELVPVEDRVNVELAQICRAYVTDDPMEIRLTLDVLLGRGVSGLLAPHPAERQREFLAAWGRRLQGHPLG